MNNRNDILDLWIMSERFSEGDITITKDMIRLDTVGGDDYYNTFRQRIKTASGVKDKNEGIIIYFDIFDFQEVSTILREKFGLEEKYEEITSGSKFSFAVCLDDELNFDEQRFFFTAGAYIRYRHIIPGNKELNDFEQMLRERIAQYFNETSSDSRRFNEAFRNVLNIFQNKTIEKSDCCFKIVKSFKTEEMNLHSFFTDDLKKAFEIRTGNLEKYLSGKCRNKINLDSKKKSPYFAEKYFINILHPERYPSGRFPGNTKFALSFMQQIAVNLACSKEKETLMSVNGPPGTGKTTLLKDVFAELAVKQALDICNMQDTRITSKDKYGIGFLPESIAEKNIVVASSNNGAVQNIVNELPLISAIDEELLPELIDADYFMKLSNSRVQEKVFQKDGRWTSSLKIEPNKEESQFWGMYSLEGGKKANVSNIISRLKCIYRYFQDEYDEQPGIYEKFMREYKSVCAVREQADAYSVKMQVYYNDCRKLDEYIKEYEKSSVILKSEYDKLSEKYSDEYTQLTEKQKSVSDKLEQLSPDTAALKSEKDRKFIELEKAIANKPSIISRLVKGNGEYNSNIAGINAQIKLLERDIEIKNKEESELRSEMEMLSRKIKECVENRKKSEDEYNQQISRMLSQIECYREKTEKFRNTHTRFTPLDLTLDYDDLHKSNPWFDQNYRKAQSRLFITSLRVRKQFLYENRKNIKRAYEIWYKQKEYLESKDMISAAWHWINFTIPVISSTFASFSRMCSNLEPETMGHLFIDEAGQALPQAAVGAIFRSRYVMVVGDPFQIKPVLTMDSSVIGLLRKQFNVSEKYLSDSASVQTVVDSASRYGFYCEPDCDEDSWIGIPLWVHRRCQYPMFTISNRISYNDLMVQGTEGYGKTGWFDVKGRAVNKYVKAQGDFLADKLSEMIKNNPEIADKNAKDVVYVITPFSNVAYNLARRLSETGFTRYNSEHKPTNVGTVHTFQGKEAPVVFMVLGADEKSRGAASWAVSEPNMMNVAATRAKKEFYVIGDKNLYQSLGSEVADDTLSVISRYSREHPELVETLENNDTVHSDEAEENRLTGVVSEVRNGKNNKFAFVNGDDKIKYTIMETEYAATENAASVINKGKRISFVLSLTTEKHKYISDIRAE